MRNRIPCTAERLSLLAPPMIQGVVDKAAFQIGHQYLSENRVRIVEADESQISSAVIGNSGLYEQTIRLKDGQLISKCSCTLPEEPMCRHCIAVLLEYHRWVQPRGGRRKETRETTSTQDNGKPAAPPVNSGDLKLSEIMAFVEWLLPAMKALERGDMLPGLPASGTGEAGAWIHAIRNLDDRRRESEDIRLQLESDMRDREAYIGRVTQQLQNSLADAKSARASVQELQQELTTYKEMIGRVGDLCKELGRYDSEIKSVAGELLSKGSQLDKLAGSFREIVAALKTASKVPPAS